MKPLKTCSMSLSQSFSLSVNLFFTVSVCELQVAQVKCKFPFYIPAVPVNVRSRIPAAEDYPAFPV